MIFEVLAEIIDSEIANRLMRESDDEGPVSLVSRQQLRVLLNADAQAMYLHMFNQS